jgi:hypothetical protein
MAPSFPPNVIGRLRAAEEVEIETAGGPGEAAHRTIIWVVVDDQGRVLVRTYLGPRSRWYREARSQPSCWLHLGGEAIAVTAAPATDEERVEACSRGYLAKYAPHRATSAMLDPVNLPTTLELLPR